MASVQPDVGAGAGAGAELRAISRALGLDVGDDAVGAGAVDVAELLTAIRKLKQQSQPPQPQPQQSPNAPVVVPRSRSNSVCVSIASPAAAAAATLPAVMHAHPDPARCDVAIRCRILNARLPPVVQPLVEEGDDEASVGAAGAAAAAAPSAEAAAAAPALERKEVSSDEEQEAEAEVEKEAEVAGVGKRKWAVSTTAEDSGVEGHKKAKPAGEAACASEHSCSSSTASACSTLTATTSGAKKAAAAVATTPEQYQVRVIHAEGAVLEGQSEYFARAFGGGWKETGSRELTLTFDDEEGACRAVAPWAFDCV